MSEVNSRNPVGSLSAYPPDYGVVFAGSFKPPP